MSRHMRYMAYDAGYHQAIVDIASFINRPNAPLAKMLCKPSNLEKVMHFIFENIDEFKECPDLFNFNYEVKGKELRLWR